MASSTPGSSQWLPWMPLPQDVMERADKKWATPFKNLLAERTKDNRRENREKIARVVEKLNAMYESGVPFFTRDAIRDMAEQLDRLDHLAPHSNHMGPPEGRAHTFTVKDLDGNPVEISVTLGGELKELREPMDTGSPKICYLSGAHLKICFEPIDHLTSLNVDRADSFNPDHAFLPIKVTTIQWVLRPDQLDDANKDRGDFDKMDTLFHSHKARIEASTRYQELISSLDSVPIPQIKKIVLFPCGGLQQHQHPEDLRHNAAIHTMVPMLREYITKRQNMAQEEIQCFADFFRYVDSDKKFLAHVGVTAMNNHRGFLEVDETCIVLYP